MMLSENCFRAAKVSLSMATLQITGQNLGRVFNSRTGCMCAMQLQSFETKLPNLKEKNWDKQLLGSVPFDIALSPLGQALP
jgi:hypothetical protein